MKQYAEMRTPVASLIALQTTKLGLYVSCLCHICTAKIELSVLTFRLRAQVFCVIYTNAIIVVRAPYNELIYQGDKLVLDHLPFHY